MQLTRQRRESGVAILMVLIAVALLAVLVLGFASNMSTELRISDAVEKTYRAQLLADGALSHAIDVLRTNIPDPVPLDEIGKASPPNWVTNPGRLTLIDAAGGQLTHVPLHSGAAPGNDDERSVDLNRPVPGHSHGPIANDPDSENRPEMRVAWIPVLKDPGKPVGPDNRMVGRYAFWIDDESTKINFSTAIGKPMPQGSDNWRVKMNEGAMTPRVTLEEEEWELGEVKYSLGHPITVNLDILFDDPEMLDVSGLMRHSRYRGFHRYPDSLMRYVEFEEEEDSLEWYRDQQWNLTFYSRSPEFNVFGEPRLFPVFLLDSLEIGPAYQMPFYYNGKPRLQTITGEAGMIFTKETEGNYIVVSHDEEAEKKRKKTEAKDANNAKLAAAKVIYDYLRRPWPSSSNLSNMSNGSSFVEAIAAANAENKEKRNPRPSEISEQTLAKREAKQLALNIVTMARLGTAPVSTGSGFPWEYRKFATSMNRHSFEVADLYANVEEPSEIATIPPDEQLQVPELDLWYLDDKFRIIQNPGKDDIPLLPQTPGPYISEIKAVVTPVPVIDEDGEKRAFVLGLETELFMNPNGMTLQKNPFAVQVDSISFGIGTAKQPDKDRSQKLDQPSWDDQNLAKLRAGTAGSIGPEEEQNYKVAASMPVYLTNLDSELKTVNELNPQDENDREQLVLVDKSESNLKFFVKLRLGLGYGFGPRVKQLVPMPRFEEHEENYLSAEIDLESLDEEYVLSWEVADPRVSAWKQDWVLLDDGEDSMGEKNTIYAPDADQESMFRYLEFDIASSDSKLDPEEGRNLFVHDWEHSRLPSVGYFSLLHTGIQSGAPWRNLSLSSDGSGFAQAVLLDLFGINYRRERQSWWDGRNLPNEWGSVVFMNSTAGQVNLNCRVYPESNYFDAPQRTKPLAAVFRYLMDEGEEEDLARKILEYQDKDQVFEYVAELSKIWDKGDTAWEREKLLRNMSSTLTTRTNTFGVWGVAQVVQKAPGHILRDLFSKPKYDEFQSDDNVMGERRFYALVERYIWQGNDGMVGNGNLDSYATWDRIADPPGGLKSRGMPGAAPMLTPTVEEGETGEFAEIDGPSSVTMEHDSALADLPYRKCSLEEANNPADPVIKYRVVFFRYLDS